MSTPEERFALAKQVYLDALSNWDADLDACGGDDKKMRAVNDNLKRLQTQMLRAAREWLAATGDVAEAAYEAAKAAKKSVDDARENELEIVARLGAFADLLDTIKTLIDKTKKPKPVA